LQQNLPKAEVTVALHRQIKLADRIGCAISRGEIPIEADPPCLPISRGFLPCRLSVTGPAACRNRRDEAGIRNPSHKSGSQAQPMSNLP